MADDDAALHDAVCIQPVGADLPEHFQNGFPADVPVIVGIAVFQRQRIVAVFQIRQPDLYLAFEFQQRVRGFKAAAVVYHGYRKLLVQALQNGISEVGRGD